MEGWIKLHRSYLEHWLCDEYRPLTKREAWETMLFTVNYDDKKILIKGQLIDCKRGQSLLSIENWSKKFVWSTGATRHFFELLKNDKMILTEGLKSTTRLTICNYDKYQDKQQPDNELKEAFKDKNNSEGRGKVSTTATRLTNCVGDNYKDEQRANNELTTNCRRADDELTTTTKEIKKYIYSKFYDFEINIAKEKENKDYPHFVDWLFKNNINKRPLTKVLNLKDQITVEMFEKYLKMYGADKLKETIISMDNYTKKTYSSFNSTLNNWLKPKEKK